MTIKQLSRPEIKTVSGGSQFFPGYTYSPFIMGSVFSNFNQPGLNYGPISWYQPGYNGGYYGGCTPAPSPCTPPPAPPSCGSCSPSNHDHWL